MPPGRISDEIAKPSLQADEDQIDRPELLFITQTGPRGPAPASQERKWLRTHIMLRHVYKRKEELEQKHRSRVRRGAWIAPAVDQLLGAGGIDPFDSLPVPMSSSNSSLLYFCRRSSLFKADGTIKSYLLATIFSMIR